MTPLITSVAIFYIYVSYCLWKYNLTRSISITVYKHDKPDRWLFIAFMFGFSTPLAFAAQGWMFTVAMFMAWLTGIFWNSRKSKFYAFMHVAGSILMIAFGMAGLWYHYGLWGLTLIGGLGVASVWIPQVAKHTWLIEVWAMIIISFGIYLAQYG